MRKSLPYILLLILLTACGFKKEQDSTPFPALPPSKVSPTLTFTPTLIPTHTISPTPTFNPYIEEVISPDSRFIAKRKINWSNHDEKPVIEIWSKANSLIWKIPPTGTPIGDPLAIAGWSSDSSKLYFFYSFSYDGWYTLFNGSYLQSLDVNTGEIKDVVSGCCIAFAFTPDMKKVAYTANRKVGILDLVTGTDKSVPILSRGFEQAGWIFISPSEKKVIFHTLMEYDGTAIYLDILTMKQKIYLDKYFIEDYTFDGWTPEEYLRYQKSGRNIVVINPNDRTEQVLGTVTPWP